MFKRTIPGLFHKQAQRYGDRVLCYAKDPTTQGWSASTWRQAHAECEALTAALIGLGVERGDRVGIVSETRREWAAADLAIVCAGGITVGVYPTSTPEQTAYVLNHAETAVCFVEDEEQLDKLLSIQDQVPSLSTIVLFEAGAVKQSGAAGLHDLIEDGRIAAEQNPTLTAERWQAVEPADLAMLVYTSGTTGPPKGVMLTHNNVYATIEALLQVMPAREDDMGVIFLPLGHVLQRMASYAGLYAGSTGVYAERLDKIMDHMAEFKPTVQAAVPRIYEKIHAKIYNRVGDASPVRQKLFHWAVDVGREVSRRQRAGQSIGRLLETQHKAADRLVLKRIRDVFGGRIRYMVSGAAPIGMELLEFFHACGIPIMEGYGLTETSGPATINRQNEFRFGTVGRDLPICETKIADDGEILIRGDNVFTGYYNDEAATAEAFTEDGWFRSGDIGEKDAQGFLRITDRKKELIITAAGKNVSPANVENRVKGHHPLISQCVVHGDQRKFLVALIALDPDELQLMMRRMGVAGSPVDAVSNTKVVGEVQLIIDAVNRDLARYETIKYFRILDKELSVADDLLTPTLKLKRRNIQAHYSDQIEAMYALAKVPKKRQGDLAI